MFKYSMRVIQRVRGTKEVVEKIAGQTKRVFKVGVGERSAAEWNCNEYLLDIFVTDSDLQWKENADHNVLLEREG